jgi:hypothetical protein
MVLPKQKVLLYENVFNWAESGFIPRKAKCSPLILRNIATCLAIWFMDDGGRGANTPLGLVLDVTSKCFYCLNKKIVERISHFFFFQAVN